MNPSPKIVLEMLGWPDWTSWLARPLSEAAVQAMSPEARRERKYAQVRITKAKAKLDRTTFSKVDVYPPVEEPYRHPARDWLDLTNGRNVLRVAK
jgi:hypothetical protein